VRVPEQPRERCLRLIALHGFLGRASDWDALAGWFPDALVTPVDIWSIVATAASGDREAIASALDRELADVLRQAAGEPSFLLAYSFGARLALSSGWLSGADSPVRGCCLVSCHPGLPDDDLAAREARRRADETWARRIEHEPESALWHAWDAQPAFAGSAIPTHRSGLPASRETLARALRACSLASQPDFRSRLCGWPVPLLWVTGARDRRFTALARDLRTFVGRGEFVECEEAGHRVPWDNPSAFARAVRGWTTRVLEAGR
jgi:2-succinyl-6-hydroxy-2,4-cyclohexadiene-1-carboxylate synthase